MLALLLAACGGGGRASNVADAMRLLPRNAEGLLYVDVDELFAEPDLRPLRRSFEDEWDYTDLEDDFGIDFGDLRYVAFGEVDGDAFFILGGLDGLEDLRDELDDGGYDEDEFRNIEIWVDRSSFWEAFAFMPDGRVVIAEYEDGIEDVIRRFDRKGPSLFDDASDLVSALPSGVIITVLPDCGIEDCDFFVFSIDKKDHRDLNVVLGLDFHSERDAERAIDDLEEDLEEALDCYDTDVTQAGERIIASAVCDTDLIAEDFEGFDF